MSETKLERAAEYIIFAMLVIVALCSIGGAIFGLAMWIKCGLPRCI